MMKKILTLTLALLMALSLAACGGKEEPKPSGNDTPPAASQQEPATTPNDSQPSGSETPAAGNSVSDVLAKYGLTEDAVKPDEAYSEVTTAENAWGGDDVTFTMGGTSVDAAAFNTKLFHAIADISDDGKVYSVGSEFTAGTGGDIAIEQAGVEADVIQWGYIYGGTKMMITSNIASDIVLGFSAMP